MACRVSGEHGQLSLLGRGLSEEVNEWAGLYADALSTSPPGKTPPGEGGTRGWASFTGRHEWCETGVDFITRLLAAVFLHGRLNFVAPGSPSSAN